MLGLGGRGFEESFSVAASRCRSRHCQRVVSHGTTILELVSITAGRASELAAKKKSSRRGEVVDDDEEESDRLVGITSEATKRSAAIYSCPSNIPVPPPPRHLLLKPPSTSTMTFPATFRRRRSLNLATLNAELTVNVVKEGGYGQWDKAGPKCKRRIIVAAGSVVIVGGRPFGIPHRTRNPSEIYPGENNRLLPHSRIRPGTTDKLTRQRRKPPYDTCESNTDDYCNVRNPCQTRSLTTGEATARYGECTPSCVSRKRLRLKVYCAPSSRGFQGISGDPVGILSAALLNLYHVAVDRTGEEHFCGTFVGRTKRRLKQCVIEHAASVLVDGSWRLVFNPQQTSIRSDSPQQASNHVTSQHLRTRPLPRLESVVRWPIAASSAYSSSSPAFAIKHFSILRLCHGYLGSWQQWKTAWQLSDYRISVRSPKSESVRSDRELQEILMDLWAAEHSDKDPDEGELTNSPANLPPASNSQSFKPAFDRPMTPLRWRLERDACDPAVRLDSCGAVIGPLNSVILLRAQLNGDV
ncbi:hypothetical protein C8R45DRAFT_943419 [Mycena sanguinolenta]|nr:hypothetical protein C8R45DRAFT_943419 [Mycena sanguinolenta]